MPPTGNHMHQIPNWHNKSAARGDNCHWCQNTKLTYALVWLLWVRPVFTVSTVDVSRHYLVQPVSSTRTVSLYPYYLLLLPHLVSWHSSILSIPCSVFVVTLILTTTLYIIFSRKICDHIIWSLLSSKPDCSLLSALLKNYCICNCCVFVYVNVNANCIIQTEGQTFTLTFRPSSTSLSNYTHSLSVFFTCIHTVWLWSIWKASVKLSCFHLHLTWR